MTTLTPPSLDPDAAQAALRAALQRAGLTQAELAERMGVHRVSVAKVLSGARPASLEFVLRVLDALEPARPVVPELMARLVDIPARDG